MTTMNDQQRIAHSLSQMRRNIIRDLLPRVARMFGEFDYSLPHLATLLILVESGEQTIKGMADLLGRSLSATSRLLDQLVVRGMIDRHEDTHDRRMKRVAITARGRQFIESIEQQRAEIQIAVMEYLSSEERAEAIRGMELVLEASRRKQRHEHDTATTATARRGA